MKSSGNDDNNDSDGPPPPSQRKILDKAMQDQLKERRDERLLFERFQNAATDRLNQLARQAEESKDGGGPRFTMGEEERRLISNMNGMGLKEGVVAGLATFLVLRRGPVYVARWVNRRRQQQTARQSQYYDNSSTRTPPPQSDGYQLSDPRVAVAGTSVTSNPFLRAAANPESPRWRRSFVARSIWFVFDVTLSLMTAASVSMAYTDADKIRKQILEMPLVAGRSLTADALCDDVVQELVKVQEEKNPTYERLQRLSKEGRQTPASLYLQGIVQFCENCQRRRYLEKLIRQERGLESGQPVEIPSPGVERNGPRLVVNSSGEEIVLDSSDDDGGFETQFGSHEVDWADDFVSDKEDQDRTR
jgi:hypothetical protein